MARWTQWGRGGPRRGAQAVGTTSGGCQTPGCRCQSAAPRTGRRRRPRRGRSCFARARQVASSVVPGSSRLPSDAVAATVETAAIPGATSSPSAAARAARSRASPRPFEARWPGGDGISTGAPIGFVPINRRSLPAREGGDLRANGRDDVDRAAGILPFDAHLSLLGVGRLLGDRLGGQLGLGPRSPRNSLPAGSPRARSARTNTAASECEVVSGAMIRAGLAS